MWRGGYNEDWERKKEYLIRTLFQNIPLLSPVPEEDDSYYESSSRVSPSNYRARTQTEVRRPYSPLPPLIVEREPNRHDEPEEYYQQLTRKMRTLYRQLFLEERSLDSFFEGNGTDESSAKNTTDDSWQKTYEIEKSAVNQRSSSNAHIEVDVSGPIDTTFVQNADPYKRYSDEMQERKNKTKSIDQNHSKHSNTTTGSDGSNYEHNVESEESNVISEINEESSDVSERSNNIDVVKNQAVRAATRSPASSVTSDPGGHYQQVTFQAEVHRESSVEDESRLSLVYDESVLEEDGDQTVARLEKTSVSDLITDRIKTTSYQLDRSEIETMRSPREFCIRTSYGTLQGQPYIESDEHISPEVSRHSLADYSLLDKSKSKSGTDAEYSSDDFLKLLQSSTPKAGKKRLMVDQTVFDNTFPTYFSNKRRRFEDVAIQVNEMMEWSSLRGNFFIGTPKMFRLCSCKDHSCTC